MATKPNKPAAPLEARIAVSNPSLLFFLEELRARFAEGYIPDENGFHTLAMPSYFMVTLKHPEVAQ